MPKGIYVRKSGVGGSVPVGVKTCGICGVTKPMGDFHVDRKGGDGRRWCCNPCRKRTAQAYYQRTKHSPQLLKRLRVNHLKRFGMTVAEYDRLYEQQHGVCAICRENPRAKPLHIDHDHKTEMVRGLLCHGCNLGIGLMREDPTVLASAILYLKGAGNEKRD